MYCAKRVPHPGAARPPCVSTEPTRLIRGLAKSSSTMTRHDAQRRQPIRCFAPPTAPTATSPLGTQSASPAPLRPSRLSYPIAAISAPRTEVAEAREQNCDNVAPPRTATNNFRRQSSQNAPTDDDARPSSRHRRLTPSTRQDWAPPAQRRLHRTLQRARGAHNTRAVIKRPQCWPPTAAAQPAAAAAQPVRL